MSQDFLSLDELYHDVSLQYRIEEVVEERSSAFQDIRIVRTKAFGVVLMLDGMVQSCEKDEHIYHELLCHPALLHHPDPRSVFIMGGGEGCTAREVLRHPGVERVVMCDIDGEVVELCKRHFPSGREAFEDPRLRVEIADAGRQLEREGRFDVIISDLADPVEDGPCRQLFSREFMDWIRRQHLHPGGVFATQSSNAGPLTCRAAFTTVHHTMRQVFPVVIPYADLVPSFADLWGWQLGLDDPDGGPLSTEAFDARVRERGLAGLRYLDGLTWQRATTFSRPTRRALAEEARVICTDAPRAGTGGEQAEVAPWTADGG